MGGPEVEQPDPSEETPAVPTAEDLRRARAEELRRERAEQARRDREHNERELNHRGWQNTLHADTEGWE